MQFQQKACKRIYKSKQNVRCIRYGSWPMLALVYLAKTKDCERKSEETWKTKKLWKEKSIRRTSWTPIVSGIRLPLFLIEPKRKVFRYLLKIQFYHISTFRFKSLFGAFFVLNTNITLVSFPIVQMFEFEFIYFER